MKKFDGRRYFVFVVPLLLLFRVISFFTVDAYITSEFYARVINMFVIIIICFAGLFFAKKKS